MTGKQDTAPTLVELFDGGEVKLLLDPAWGAENEDDAEPPPDAILGGWAVTADGMWTRFRSNPDYRPRSADAPLDPVDAVLRAMARGVGEDLTDDLTSTLFDTVFGVAVDEKNVALVRSAPDGVSSVLATTAYGHRALLDVPGWVEVTLPQLAAALPETGVDVLLNPGSPAAMRVRADVIRATAESPDGVLDAEKR
ncbi:hypothetical protein DMC61_40095 [Amycolatopsis sp. WAC 04169]|uniref:type VII secretion system-associated protein n=1 Tax=Amycolatopsis sp. WAC 04169 TaxID=2203197 RepID=UPI000F7B74D8|nr:type VII secretion system-associated protein [Amycolatopsis sp. WAC 04169]RSN19281.1 hypothetical protein DMC61_40095 [Amycolatopsis sp. WAC 04169]